MKKILIMLFSISILGASAQNSNNNGNHRGGGNNGNGVGNNPSGIVETQVPFDDYVPLLVAGVVVYGICVNFKRKTVQA